MKYSSCVGFENCCGMRQIGAWCDDNNQYGKSFKDILHPEGSNASTGYTGIFTATFNKSENNLEAEKELKAQGHTLLYETEYYSNLSRYSEPIGRERGVKLCVFLHKNAPPPIKE